MQALKDYSENLNLVYSSNDIVTTNLGSLVVQTLVKDSSYIYSTSCRVSGLAVTIARIIKLTSSVNNQVIFSQKETGKGISIETNGSGYLTVNINGSSFFGSLQLSLNTVYAIGLTYNGKIVTLIVNNTAYQVAFTETIIESTSDMLVNLTGQSGIIFYTDVAYADLETFLGSIFYLGTHYKMFKNVGTSPDVVKGGFVGIGKSLSGVVPDDSATMVYEGIPISFINDIVDSVVVNGSVHSISDKYRKQNIRTLIINSEQNTSKTELRVFGESVFVFDATSTFESKFVSSITGRVLGYTRTVNGANYDHKFYVDYSEVDSFTSADAFAKSGECEIPISISNTQIEITPSEYILDDLIIDNKVYVKDQFRAFYLADELVDDLNAKILIAPVIGFSNQIIYSVGAPNIPIALQLLADANKDIKTIVRYES